MSARDVQDLLVVHVITGLEQGSIPALLHRLLSAPQQAGRHVVVSLNDEGVFGAPLRRAGIAVHTLGIRRPGARLAALWRLHRLLRTLRPDVVQTWMRQANALGGLVARLARVRAVVWHVCDETLRPASALVAPLSHVVPHAIVVCAEAVRAQPAGRDHIRISAHEALPALVTRWQAVWAALAHGHRPGPRRLLMMVNEPAYFLSHRLPVAQAARKAGYEVHVATRPGAAVQGIRDSGFHHHSLPLSRSGRNPLAELRLLLVMWRLMRRLRPDLVHAVTIKPVLYGGLAARMAGVPAYVAAVSGLGHVFTHEDQARPLRWLILHLYRLALGHRNSRVIFQNRADEAVLASAGALHPGQAVLIPGSGVDLRLMQPVPEPPGPVVILCVARMLRDKGIVEFAQAARRLRARYPEVQCWLAGGPDPGNPSAISVPELQAWHAAGWLRWLGMCDDVPALYRRAHIGVLPSYREGLPRSLVEATASGRAVVATDVPGCRDTVLPGVSGLLVPPRDAHALTAALAALIEAPERRRAMGRAGRRLAERRFGIDDIVARHMAVYGALMAGVPGRN